jgi:opacity protein-like surface antigen
MKKIMTMVVAAMLATVSVNAQQEVGSFTIQPHIGGTAGMMTNADIAPKAISVAKLDKTPNGGSMAGVEFEYQLAQRFSLAAGVNYMQAGTAWKDINHDGVKFKDMKVETSYVTVPVVANVYLCKGLALKSGVQFAFLTDAKTKFTEETSIGDLTKKTEMDTSCKDQFNKFDVSIPVGISYEFKVPIVIDLRYNIGLTKVNKVDNLFGNKGDSRSHTCTLTVGYKFKL